MKSSSQDKQVLLNAAPISPRLSIYRWRLTMLASIMHRASGVFLVLVIPAAFWLLLTMAHDNTNYMYALVWLQGPIGTFLLWLTSVALFYHFSNGVRFLCLDAGWGESRTMMKTSAKLVLASTLFMAILLAIKI